MTLDLRSKIETMRGVILIISVVLFVGCSNDRCRESIAPVPVSLEVTRIEKEISSAQSSAEVENVLSGHMDFARIFLNADQYPSGTILAENIFNLYNHPSFDSLYSESITAFENSKAIPVLEESFGRLKSYYPELIIPVIQTIVTGLKKDGDLYFDSNSVIIGLDYFIGAHATYKPQQIPDYILRRYDAEHLPADIMQFVSSQFIQTSKEETMLAEMIDYGKSYYLLSKILPCTPEHILMGYTKEEWDDSFENDAIIWANFIENELLFDTNHQMKQKFLGERPNVYEIGDKCPGRIGRWVGWQIVNAYAERSGVSVTELMKETDANKIFRLSQYKPSGS